MKTDAKTEAAIKDLLYKFADHYARRNLQSMLSLVSAEPDVMLYGTGLDERRIGLDAIRMQIERDWSQTDSTAIEYRWTMVSGKDPIAWAASDVMFHIETGGKKHIFPARMTAVTVREGDEWKIAHMHVSFPSEQAEGESFPQRV